VVLRTFEESGCCVSEKTALQSFSEPGAVSVSKPTPQDACPAA
jgi:hypothetical protein